MLKILTFILFFLVFKTNFSQNTNFDSTLAKKLDADDYGMKKFVFVILKSGVNTSNNKEHKDSCFKEHLNNIGKLAKINKLVVAGPILSKNENQYRGIFILNVKTKEEAIDLLKTDAAIKFNYLDYELYEWYGSAALETYLENVEKVNKKQF